MLATSRIRLEPMVIQHLPLLVELGADAEVLRYILARARSRAGGAGPLGAYLC